jgi:formylglycine-generating enzyme required for sulfatase activity
MRWVFCLVALLFRLEVYAVLFVREEAEAGAMGESYKPTDPRGEANTNVSRMPASAVSGSGSTFFDCTDGCPAMVVVGAGKFLMGSEHYAREQPQHTVSFPTQFAVGKFDITFDEWAACAKDGGCWATQIRRMKAGGEEGVL